jgi:RNA ligase (TIGR02306 family)
MSEHLIEVVPVELIRHPNADSLSCVKVHGWNVIVKTSAWEGKKLGIYIPPDYVVDAGRPEFAWLRKDGFTKHRVRVQKLRGIVSQGFLVPAPDDAILGDNWFERLGIERYEQHIPGIATGGQAIAGPPGYHPVYDVENFYARDQLLTDGEDVVITEKLHGSCGRFVFAEGEMWCGSRKEWKAKDSNSIWWNCLKTNLWIEEYCSQRPGDTVYGEVLGVQGGFPYGKTETHIPFRVFDVLVKDTWMEFGCLISLFSPEQRVPKLFDGPFNKEMAIAFAEGKTTIENATHIREGIVIQAVPERSHPRYGRIKLKIVGNTYLEKS